MSDWDRWLGQEYYSIRMMATGRVVRVERFRTLLHFWLELPDRCARCRVDDVVHLDVFPRYAQAARRRDALG